MKLEVFDNEGEGTDITLTQLYEATRAELGEAAAPRLERLYTGGLASKSHDTNDGSTVYTWDKANDIEGLKYDKGVFIATGLISIQVSPKIAVLDATANDRAAFLMSVFVDDPKGNWFEQFCFTSVYIRDDNPAFDKGVAAGSCSFTLKEGESFRVQTNRLSSQDASDDNPAHASGSNLMIHKWV